MRWRGREVTMEKERDRLQFLFVVQSEWVEVEENE